MDRRAVPGLLAGLAGLAFGVAAALFASPALAVVSAGCALVAGAASLVVLRSVQGDQQLPPTRPATETSDHAGPAEAVVADPAPGSSFIERPPIDAQTGLPDGTYFELAAAGRVAAARRHLWPVTVVVFELVYGPSAADANTRGATALTVAGLLRQTLREADIACRLGTTTFGLILEDTSEDGAVWTVERLQIALSRDEGRVDRVCAGIATYPSHGLRSDEIVQRAQQALARACSATAAGGLGPVEVASVDPH